MSHVDWKDVLDKAILESGSETFAEDWAEDLVDAAIDSDGEDVGIVLSRDGYMSISIWAKGEHANTATKAEVVRISAFDDLSVSGEQRMLQTPVGTLVEGSTWSDFVQTYVAEKLGCVGQTLDESIQWVNQQGITWEDFKKWDLLEYNLVIDAVVEMYLVKVREVVAGQIKAFGQDSFVFEE